jgi:glucose dehydrogenase
VTLTFIKGAGGNPGPKSGILGGKDALQKSYNGGCARAASACGHGFAMKSLKSRFIERSTAALTLTALTLTASAQTKVDDHVLAHASANGQWLTYGGDYAETRFSTLDQINIDNVDRLEVAFSVEVGSDGARMEATPLVIDGVLYGTTAWNITYAIDLRTQSLKWRWDPGIVRGVDDGGTRLCCGPVNRGPAFYDGKVIVGLLDGRLAALDAQTGHVAWIVQTTPEERIYSITGAPRVVAGNVIIGNGGADLGGRGFVTAYDAQTGRQVWRFYIVPGDPSLPFEHPELEYAATTWTANGGSAAAAAMPGTHSPTIRKRTCFT